MSRPILRKRRGLLFDGDELQVHLCHLVGQGLPPRDVQVALDEVRDHVMAQKRRVLRHRQRRRLTPIEP